ncbi:MAG: FCD domain-containing protein, partial [Treponema sp.]|nr:FCD domain-containing protein [Treponema sp.]
GHLPQEKLLEFHERFTSEAPPIRDAMWLDTAMHLFIVEHSGNRFLIDMMRRVFEENLRIIISSRQNEAEIHDARAEHAAILEMLIAGQIDAAALAMFDHLCHCEQAALEFFYNSSARSAIPIMYHASMEQIYSQ